MVDLKPLVEAIADAVVRRLNGAQQKMIPQSTSDLSPRRHREAVKRRLRNGEGGAGIDGRKHLLTREAMLEELARDADRTPSTPKKRRPPSGAPAAPPPPKSRAREMSEFERDLMNGLRDVK